MEKYYGNSWVKVIEDLDSDIHKGLYEDDCNLRRNIENNRIELPYSKGFFKLLLGVLRQRYLYVYLLFITFFFLNKFYLMGIVLSFLLIINIFFKLYNEIHKEKEIEILQNLNTSQVLVLREGIEKLVEAENLVKGDIVYFRKNSIIAADIRIIDSDNLKVDERGVTGDNLIKEKDAIKIEDKVSSIGEISNMIFRGSIIKEGSGKGIVVEVGKNTQLGKLVNIISNTNNKKDILIKSLEINLFKITLCLILVHAILILIFPGKLLDKTELFAQGVFAIGSILFPLIVLNYGKYYKKSLLEDNEIELNNFSILALIKDVKIFFMDKLGNISKKELYVEKLYTNEQIYLSNKIDSIDINIKRLIDISVLCNNAKYNGDNNFIKGDIYEVAYVKFGIDNSVYKGTLESSNRRKFQINNSFNGEIITTLNKNKKGYRANSRGKLESILECCTHILINGIEREITSEDIIKIKLADLNFSKEGLLTEAFAYRSFYYEPSKYENIESNLVFVGIIALENPLIDDAIDDINNILGEGVLPIIFTDENKLSAEFFGRKLGLVSEGEQVISGAELEYLNNEDLLKAVSKARIYCKVNPETKNKIVSLYNRDGYGFIAEGETLADLSIISLANLGIVKGKISMLLRKIGDVFIEKSSIKAFFDLKDRSKDIYESTKRGLNIYTIIMLSEIIFLNFQYLFGKGILYKEYFILMLNLFILFPILLLHSIYGKYSCMNKKVILRGTLFILIPIIAISFSKENYDVIGLVSIGGISILDTLINCKMFSKKNIKALNLFLISIFIYAVSIGVLVILNNFKFNIIEVVIEGWLLFIFLLADLIIRKW
ncbi:hypothetical protein [uncultured Clostridium sp.]|uniref:P-type ATPase n=1 Tax=uncultured Clostridium sp. TaxID=59620 RepID=UPI002587621D|nr:hypothetical protein [uncultured Clostridium sp.]